MNVDAPRSSRLRPVARSRAMEGSAAVGPVDARLEAGEVERVGRL